MERTEHIPARPGSAVSNGANRGTMEANRGTIEANRGPLGANRGPVEAPTTSKQFCDSKSPLSVLQEVQKAYEDRLQVIDRVGGPNKLEMTVEVLRAWVSDLVGQNTLLTKVVEDLEMEATARFLKERSRHHESDKQKWTGSSKEFKAINDVLQIQNIAKEREIRRLNKDIQQYEQTLVKMRAERSRAFQPDVPTKDAEVMVEMSFRSDLAMMDMTGFSSLPREDAAKYQERIRKMEGTLKSTGESVRALRKVNVALSEELHALRRVCAALDEQARAAGLRAQFKDDIIREMRRQLKQAKAKLRECSGTDMKLVASGDASKLSMLRSQSREDACLRQPRRDEACVRQPRPAGLDSPSASEGYREDPLHPESDDCHTPRFDGSGDDTSGRQN